MKLTVKVKRMSAGFFAYLQKDGESEPKFLDMASSDGSEMGIKAARAKLDEKLNVIYNFINVAGIDCDFDDGALNG